MNSRSMSSANIRMCIESVYSCLMLVKCNNVLLALEGNVITYNTSSLLTNLQYLLDLEVSVLTITHFTFTVVPKALFLGVRSGNS